MERVSALQIKLPTPFWPADQQVWFAQVEAQLQPEKSLPKRRNSITYVVASKASEFTTEVCDLILHPPETNPYSMVKEQLILRTAALERRRLQQLFNAEGLGDRKPSQLICRMQQLLGDEASSA